MLQIIALCVLATLCAADKSGPNADAQYGGYGFYQPPHPPPPQPYGKHGGGETCKIKRCTDTIAVTHTHFDEQETLHEYPIITPVEQKTSTTSFWVDDHHTTTLAGCKPRQRFLNNVDLVPVKITHTVHECVPTSVEWILTSFKAITSLVTINECDASDMVLTVQNIKSFVTDVPTTIIGLDTKTHTMTKFIPTSTVIRHTVCTEAPTCEKADGGGHHHPTPPPTYGAPPAPSYGAPIAPSYGG